MKKTFAKGFSLIELLVSLVVVSIFFLGILAIFDRSAKMNKVETGVSDVQQNVRYASYQIVREFRQARVGNLSYAKAVIPLYNNAAPSQTIPSVSGANHPVRPGTDAVEIRGVINSALFALDPGDFAGSPLQPSNQTILIPAITNAGYYNNPAANPCYSKDGSGVCQQNGPNWFSDFLINLHAIDSTIDPSGGCVGGCAAGTTYILPVVVDDSQGNYDVGNLVSVSLNSTTPTTAQAMTLTVNFAVSSVGAYNAGASPVALTTPARVGVVDDFLYFVHDGAEGAGPGEPNPAIDPTQSHPFLAAARSYVPLNATSPFTPVYDLQGVAEDIEDFQVAYGIDAYKGTTLPLASGTAASGPDFIVYPTEYTDANGIVQPDGDEWFPNAGADKIMVQGTLYDQTSTLVGSYPLMFQYTPAGGVPQPLLRALKIAIVAKSNTADPKYQGAGALGIKAMDSTAAPVSTTLAYHRRVVNLAITLRNFEP
jgi:prepilin-type N-terminal cleavage/methylation domain-containing protein